MSREIPFYQVDAFANAPFLGNQACVMPLEDGFLADETLQKIAAENNVAETAYIVPEGDGAWQLRWFTPTVEVPLCGHATLAAAHVLFAENGFGGETITFSTRQSGQLHVRRQASGYEMDFPAPNIFETEVSDVVIEALGVSPRRAWGGPFFAAEYGTLDEIAALAPDMKSLASLGVSGHEGTWERGNFGCFTMQGEAGTDVTSRFFAPGSGIDEDPATGSWHCMLAVIAAQLSGRPDQRCFQAYPGRGAHIAVTVKGDRVELAGDAVTVIRGQFTLPD